MDTPLFVEVFICTVTVAFKIGNKEATNIQSIICSKMKLCGKWKESRLCNQLDLSSNSDPPDFKLFDFSQVSYCL